MSTKTLRIIVVALLAVGLVVLLFKILPILILLAVLGGGIWFYRYFFTKPNP